MKKVIKRTLDTLNSVSVSEVPAGLEPLYTVGEVQRWAHVSESFVRKAISRGQIRIVKIGARTLIPKSAIDDYLRGRERAQ